MSGILKKVPFVNRFFGRDQGLPPEAKAKILTDMAQSESGRTDTDVQRMQDLGTNWELLHDEDLERMWGEAMFESAVVQKDGVWTVIPHAKINYNMAALREVVSHLNRASFLTREQAVLTKIKLRCIMKRIKITMRPDQYNLGLSNYFKGTEIFMDFLLSDATDGNKAQLLKTNPRISTLQLKETTEKKKGLM